MTRRSDRSVVRSDPYALVADEIGASSDDPKDARGFPTSGGEQHPTRSKAERYRAKHLFPVYIPHSCRGCGWVNCRSV
jgi:hypothetical protein